MNSNFKFVVLVTSSSQNYIQDAKYNFITSKTPCNILLYSQNSIYLKSFPNTKEELETLYESNNSSKYFEYDEVYNLSFNQLSNVFEQNDPIAGIKDNKNQIFLFYSFAEIAKLNCIDSFFTKFNNDINHYFTMNLLPYEIHINSYISYNNEITQLIMQKSNTKNSSSTILKNILAMQDNVIKIKKYKDEEVNLFIEITVGKTKVTFIKAKSTASSIFFTPNSKNNNSIVNYFNACLGQDKQMIDFDEYDKITIITSINQSNPFTLDKTIQDLSTLNDLHKEVSHLNLFKSLQTSQLDSIKPLNPKGDELNLALGTSMSTSINDNLLGNKISINNLNNETINEPEVSMLSLNKEIITNSLKISKNSTLLPTKADNDLLLEGLVKSMSKIESYMENDKSRKDIEIKELKEELVKEKENKAEMESTISKLQHDIDMLKEDNFTLKRQNTQKENYELNLSKKLQDNSLKIEESQSVIEEQKKIIEGLTQENNELKKKMEDYDNKFLELKRNEDNMHRKIDSLQKKFNLILTMNNQNIPVTNNSIK